MSNDWLRRSEGIMLIRILFVYLSTYSKQWPTIDLIVQDPIRNESQILYFYSNTRLLSKIDVSTCADVWWLREREIISLAFDLGMVHDQKRALLVAFLNLN